MNPCDIETSAAYIGDVVEHEVGANVMDAVVTAATVVSLGIGMALMDQAHADDFSILEGGMQILEQAQAVAVVSDQAQGQGRAVERARARSITFEVIEDAVASVAVAHDLMEVRPGDDLLDAVAVSVTIESATIAQQIVISTARAHDDFIRREDDSVYDGAHASSSVQERALISSEVASTAAAFSVLADEAARDDELMDQARADGHMAGTVDAGGEVIESAFAYDWLQDAYGARSLWTCDAGTFAMSRLLPGEIHGLAVVGGVLCGCSPDGLVAFDAPAKAPKVQTGLTDFGSPAMKRGLYAYIGYNGEPLTLTVGNTGSGREVEYSYPLPARLAEAAIPARAQLGRGARSRYWRFTLTGTIFELHDVALEIAETSRKV